MIAFWGASVIASDLAAVLASELTTALASDLAIFLKGKAGWRMLLLLVPFVPAETENYKQGFLTWGTKAAEGMQKTSMGTRKVPGCTNYSIGLYKLLHWE